jgi:hypothetical protein
MQMVSGSSFRSTRRGLCSSTPVEAHRGMLRASQSRHLLFFFPTSNLMFHLTLFQTKRFRTKGTYIISAYRCFSYLNAFGAYIMVSREYFRSDT